jgi:hypothetical protein
MTEYLIYAVAFVTLIRDVLRGIEAWAFDDDSTILGTVKLVCVVLPLVAAPVVAVIALVFWLVGGPSAQERCLDSGRGWAVAGSRTELQWNPALKMAMPTTVTDYGCFEVVR